MQKHKHNRKYDTVSGIWSLLDAAAGVSGDTPPAMSHHAMTVKGTRILIHHLGILMEYSTVDKRWSRLDKVPGGETSVIIPVDAAMTAVGSVILFHGGMRKGNTGQICCDFIDVYLTKVIVVH